MCAKAEAGRFAVAEKDRHAAVDEATAQTATARCSDIV